MSRPKTRTRDTALRHARAHAFSDFLDAQLGQQPPRDRLTQLAARFPGANPQRIREEYERTWCQCTRKFGVPR